MNNQQRKKLNKRKREEKIKRRNEERLLTSKIKPTFVDGPTKHQLSVENNNWRNIIAFIKKWIKWILITLIGLGFGSYLIVRETIETTKDDLKSPEERYEDEAFITGILLPKYYLPESGELTIIYGSNSVITNLNKLEDGFELLPYNFRLMGEKTAFDIKLKLVRNRLFISRKFTDIENEEYVGNLQYDHWEFFKPNLLRLKQTDSSFEVKDRHENIMFSVLFTRDKTIILRGYSITPLGYSVMSDGYHTYTRPNKDSALVQIEKIRPIAIK